MEEREEPARRRVYSEKAYVIGRLNELDLTEEILTGAIDSAVRHVFACTENDPPVLAGMLGWGKGIRRLRELTKKRGWQRKNRRNFATVEHPQGRLAITIAAGDAFTGIDKEGANPSTRSAKGPAVADAIENNQREFSEISGGEEFPRVKDVPLAQTWILLYYVDERTEEVRAELSLPAGMTSEGHVTIWSERIILGAFAFPTNPVADVDDDDDDDTGDLDIEVRRKG